MCIEVIVIDAQPFIPSTIAVRRVLSASKIYAFYEDLSANRCDKDAGLGGSLLLYAPLNENGCIAALAGNIAGMATLGIDGNNVVLKQAVRDGICDFLVNNLDEALRILKNEVRKKQPVSVCLEQEFSTALEEIASRGVQPDFLSIEGQAPSATVEVLRTRGALDVAHAPAGGQMVGVTWTALTTPALWLPKIDTIAASIIDSADAQRQRWLRYAGRYLGRLTDGAHFIRMTTEEAAEFRSIIARNVADGSIGAAIRLALDGAENSIIELSPEA